MRQSLRLCSLLFLFFQLSIAQDLPVDFSMSQDSFTGFSGATFSATQDPTMSSNTVGQFVNDGTGAFQGFFYGSF